MSHSPPSPSDAESGRPARTGLLGPLAVGAFRAIWIANLFANLGTWAQSVAAAWVVTASQGGPLLVAMIQVAAAAPLVLLSIVSGVLADNYDRRRIMLIGLGVEMSGALLLTVLAFLQRLDPLVLIASVLWISLGAAITVPAWQAAVSEQVPRAMLGPAVLLNGVNYNVARAVGPALGGIILSALGAGWVFFLNVLAYMGLLAVLWRWRRPVPRSSLPPERVREGVVAALRFTYNSTVTRLVMLRSFVFGLSGSVIWALLPLLAQRHAGSGALLYGYMLGALGVGSIAGSFVVEPLRRLSGVSRLISWAGAVMAGCLLAVGAIANLKVVLPVLVIAGGCWVAALSQYNATVQILVPDWVKGRALALYQTALYSGLALGSFLWGHLAESMGVDGALITAGLLMAGSAALLYNSRLPESDGGDIARATLALNPPLVAFNQRVGSVLVAVEYRIAEHHVRDFLRVAPALRQLRLRNGCERWGLFRDIDDGHLWREVFVIGNWLQHLRMIDRMTIADKALLDNVASLHEGNAPPPMRLGVSYESVVPFSKDDVRDAIR